jgi:hypothetical protein
MLDYQVQLFLAGLISEAELQRAIDFENMGSDTRFILIEDLL